jgi:phytoene dehydrogenase-like protein
MAEETFDVVIIGGGNKALFLAMYLIKYANLSVGIFERRHEIGGCLATEEIAAPGFRGNTHATIQLLSITCHCGATSRRFGNTGAGWSSTW